jgi:hypothetical protein
MKKPLKIKAGDDIYLPENGEKYYGIVKRIEGNIAFCCFGTDEEIPHLLKTIKFAG